jgi:YfiH family protein
MNDASAPAALTPVVASDLSAHEGVTHGFFGRQGGVSSGLYSTLNCGLGSRDARSSVLENRARVARHLGTTGDRLLTCYQIHSADALVAAAPWTPETMPRGDAIVTKIPGIAVAALAADCTPVLFADPKARVIAAAHAGWKGALAGILPATVSTMENLGARRENIIAAVGPTIGPDNYEVGPEFLATFAAVDDEYRTFFTTRTDGGRPHFDLPRFVLHQLGRLGLGQIASATECTYANESRFFSYRRTTHRGEADYGRQISAIVLT